MRILHILDHSLPLHSGYSFRTLAILREQRSLGWETLQLTTPRHGPSDADAEMVEGWRFHRTPPAHRLLSAAGPLVYVGEMAATARRLDALAESFRPDVLHAHSPVLNALPALWVSRKRGIPVVYEVRAFWEDAAVDHGTAREGAMRYRAGRALETFALRRADHVTTICEGLKRDIVERGIPESRVTVIPNAVDVSAFRPDVAPDLALKRELGIADKTVIGFIGSFYAYEGLDLLVRALPRILEHRPDVRVLLVGGGPEETALRALAQSSALGNKVVFAGRVPHELVSRYYSIVDLFVYPRRSMRLTELVTPLKPLEAMAQGRLVVASAVGGHRELIVDGETGVLFRSGDPAALSDAILHLLEDRDRWPKLRERARSFVERERNWRASVARYTEAYSGAGAADGLPLAA
jgi:PEP-CTERM/exosortase A-associated glycosyltransferase